MIRVMLVDDHDLIRDGLRRILDDQMGIRVVGEAGDGRAAARLVGRERPDVVLLDISMPGMDGIAAAREIASDYPATKSLILTVHDDVHHALQALRAGAHGFIPKGATTRTLIQAICMVHQGVRYLPPQLEQTLAKRYLHPEEAPALERLSQREFQVLRLIAAGRDGREIAAELCISVKTVASHRHNLLKKLRLRNNADITRYAVLHKLIMA